MLLDLSKLEQKVIGFTNLLILVTIERKTARKRAAARRLLMHLFSRIGRRRTHSLGGKYIYCNDGLRLRTGPFSSLSARLYFQRRLAMLISKEIRRQS
jgi:hypothetical protein